MMFERMAHYTVPAIGLLVTNKSSPSNALFIVTMCGFLLSGQWSQKWQWLKAQPLTWHFLGYWLWLLVGCLYTQAPPADAIHMLIKHDKFIYAVALLWFFRDPKLKERALSALMWGLVWTMICGYGHWLQWFPKWVPLKNHIHVGFVLSWFVFMVAVLHVWRQRLPRYWWLLAGLAAFYTLFINLGRSGYVLLVVLLSMLGRYLMGFRGWLSMLLACTVVMMVAYQVSPYTSDRLQRMGQEMVHYVQDVEAYSSMGLRLHFYRHGVDMVRAAPWLGTGTGSVKSQYQQVAIDERFNTNNPHNAYLFVAIQFGLLGLLLFGGMLAHQWWLSRALPVDARLLTRGLLVAMMTSGLFNSPWFDSTEGHLYVFLMALLLTPPDHTLDARQQGGQ